MLAAIEAIGGEIEALAASGETTGDFGASPFSTAVVEAAQAQGRDAGTIFDRSRMGSAGAPGVDIVRFDATRAAVFKRGTTGIPNRNPRTGFVEEDYGGAGVPRMLDAFGRPVNYERRDASSYDWSGPLGSDSFLRRF